METKTEYREGGVVVQEWKTPIITLQIAARCDFPNFFEDLEHRQLHRNDPKYIEDKDKLHQIQYDLTSAWMRNMTIAEKKRIEKLFCANGLIKYLANDEAWTYNHAMYIEEFSAMTDKPTLPRRATTLEGIYRDWVKNYVDKTYYMRARDNLVIAIEVSEDAPESIKEAIKEFPVEYAEQNRNGRLYLVRLDETDIPESAEKMVDIALTGNSKEMGFKIYLNWCRVTFSRNILPRSEWTKFDRENEEHHRKITNFLDKASGCEMEWLDRTPPISYREFVQFAKLEMDVTPFDYYDRVDYFTYYDQPRW